MHELKDMGETRETPQRPGDPVLWVEGQSLCYPRNPPSEVLAPAPAQVLWLYIAEARQSHWAGSYSVLSREPGMKRTLSALVDCAGSIPAPGRRHAEPEAGAGDEEPADPPAGEEDHRAGKAGELARLLQRADAVALAGDSAR